MGEQTSRVALVTGGSRGIGRAIAESLAARGHRVAVNYVSNDEAAAQTLEEIRQLGAEAVSVRGNVADRDEVAAMVAQVGDELGPIDILVHSAGIWEASPIRELQARTGARVEATAHMSIAPRTDEPTRTSTSK